MSRVAEAGDHVTGVIASNSADLLAFFQRRTAFDDAADLVAETMMTAWRRSPAIPRDPVPARMWLFGIARNVLANAERAERRRWRLADRLRLMTAVHDVGPSPDEGAEVRDAVSRLDPALAELVRLVHWDGFTIAEAGQIVGINASTARSRYQTAKDLLRSELTLANTSDTR